MDAPAHPYMTASPACWAAYGELLAADYADPDRMATHQLVVDAYAVQHPGGEDGRAVRSVGIHLMTLALFLEDGVDPALGARLHRRMVARPVFHRLDPPRPGPSAMTHLDVPRDGAAEAARKATYAWARDAWAAWAPAHATVDGWLRTARLRT